MKKLSEFEITDMHMHFPITQDDWLKPYRDRYIAAYGREKWDYLQEMDAAQPSWLPSFGFPEPEETSSDPEAVCERWYAEAKDNGLKKAYFLTGGGNDIISSVVAAHPDVFAGFAHHDITDPDSPYLLEKAIREQGLCGYKILAPVVEKPLDSKEFEETFEVCDVYRLPVNIHFGILGGAGGVSGGVNISPSVIAEVVKRFPHAKFIIPHFGCGFTNDLLRIAWGSPNVYVDTSGNNLWTKWTMEQWSLEQLFRVFSDTMGSERIIFGTDSEWFPRGFVRKYLELQFEAMVAAGMSEAEIQNVLSLNSERLTADIRR